MNTIGQIFRLTTFGESHGTAIGGVIDGCPSQLKLDFDFIDSELQRRKTAQSVAASQRKEPDHVEWLSGLLDGAPRTESAVTVPPNGLFFWRVGYPKEKE